MNIFLIILGEFLFVSTLILFLFKLRHWLGLAPLYIFLGSLQYLQTILATTFFISLFDDYFISPGSILLFCSSLFAVLLVYIKEGVASTRSLIFGIVLANIAITCLAAIFNFQAGLGEQGLVFRNLKTVTLQLDFRVFAIGTVVLVLDFFLLIVIYKYLAIKVKKLKLFPLIFLSLFTIFCFDAIVFTSAAFYDLPAYQTILFSQLIGKIFMAFLFSVVLYFYIRYIDKEKSGALFIADNNADIFSIFTYKKQYKTLKIEKELSEEKYRSLIEQAIDGVFIADASLRFILVNSSACTMLGYTKQELLKLTIKDITLIETEETPLMVGEWAQKLTEIHERKMVRKDESIVTVEMNGARLEDGNYMAFVRDITERKKAEEQLIKSEKYLDNIINNIGDPVFVKDEQSCLLLVNDAFCKIFNLSRSNIIGKTLAEDVPPDQRESFLRIDREVIATGIENINEEMLTVRDGETQIISTKKTRFIDEEGNKFLIGAIRDITSRKKAEEQVLKTSEELRLLMHHLQNVREEERKRIGREIHDDLGQQLTAIKMFTAWIDKRIPEEQTDVKEKIASIINLLDNSNLALRKILNELRVEILDNDGLVEGLRWLCRQFEDSTSIELAFTTNLKKIKVNEQTAVCVYRILQESLNNIAKHADAKKVMIDINVTANILTMIIKDDGNGFQIEKLQTVNSFGILGMKERVSAAEGEFRLESTKGGGTRLKLAVPV